MMSFRSLTMDDLPDIKELISEAWYKKAFKSMSEERAELMFRSYIGHYLFGCTFAEVCEIDGEFAGFIIGRADGEPLLFPEQKETSFDGIPWILKHMMDKIGSADRRMLSECNDRGFDSELKLYITSGKFRGKGVGSALLGRFLDHLKESGHRKMFLFTDDYCSVDYYLKRGFREETSSKLFMEWKFHKFMLLSIDIPQNDA